MMAVHTGQDSNRTRWHRSEITLILMDVQRQLFILRESHLDYQESHEYTNNMKDPDLIPARFELCQFNLHIGGGVKCLSQDRSDS